MEGWNLRKKRFWILLGSTGLMLLGTPNLRAELSIGTVPSEARGAMPTRSHETRIGRAELTPVEILPTAKAREDGKAAPQKLQAKWAEIHAEMTRIAVETTMTMLLIRWGTTPPPDPTAGGNTPPQGGSGNTPPPPPTGQGGDPPGGSSIPPPPGGGTPSATPEPASVVSALVGAGLVSLYGWRKRRKAAQ